MDEGLLDGVARGARSRRHDGPLFAQQRVEQRRLANVGAAGDGGADAFAQDQAGAAAREQFSAFCNKFVKQGGFFFLRQVAFALFRKVKVHFELGREVRQSCEVFSYLVRESSLQCARGGGQSLVAASLDDAEHRLRLREVEAAVYERTARELAWQGKPGAKRAELFDALLSRQPAAVALDLGGFFARVTGAGFEAHDQGFVENYSVPPVQSGKGHKARRPLRECFFCIYHSIGKADAALAGEPHDGDAAFPPGRSQGSDDFFRHKNHLTARITQRRRILLKQLRQGWKS